MTSVSLRAYNREIETLIDQGRSEEAISHCMHILQSVPKHIGTYRLLGKALLELQRYTDATDIFQRVLSSVPDDFVSHVGMSIIRENEKDLDDAIWHMERAYEAQPSNAAIQDELRRLYGRRDGMEPPKIRLTSGALSRMYAKGHLYSQAIGELQTALAENANRPDLQVLLAQMYHRAGLREQAVKLCNDILKKLPHCLEANRILADILPGGTTGTDTQSYYQKLISLDPYYSKIDPKNITSDKAPENAVMIDKIDYEPGQRNTEASKQPDWAQSLGVVIPQQDEEGEIPAGTQASFPDEPIDKPSTEDLMPDFLKEAGWTPSEKTADEIALEEMKKEQTGEGLVAADIPEWLLDIAPEGALEEAGKLDGSEELPWLQETEPGPSDTVTSWLEETKPPASEKELEELESALKASTPESEETTPEWVLETEIPQPAQAEPPQEVTEKPTEPEEKLPDWLISETEETQIWSRQPEKPDTKLPEEPTEVVEPETDWKLEEPTIEPAEGLPDWLQETAQTPQPAEEVPDWLQGLDAETPIESEPTTSKEPEVGEGAALTPAAGGFDLENEDAALAWLESLAQQQGAPEDQLTTRPEDRPETPDWLIASAQEAETRGEVPTYQPTETVEGISPQPESELPSEEEKGLVEPISFEPVPDLLKETEAETPAVESAEPEITMDETVTWMAPVADESQPPSLEAIQEAEKAVEIPDWLKELGQEGPTIEPIEPELASKESTTELPTPTVEEMPPMIEETGVAAPAEEIPDWLKELEPEPTVSETVESEPAVDEALAWLPTSAVEETTAADEVVSSAVPAEEIPDWLKEVSPEVSKAELPEVEATLEEPATWIPQMAEETPIGVDETKEAEISEVIPDWLKEFSQEGEAEEVVTQPGLEGEPEAVEAEAAALEWLEEPEVDLLGDTQPTRIQTPIEEAPAKQLESELMEEIPTIEPAVEPMPEPVEEVPAWLKEEAEIEPEPISQVEPETEEIPEWIIQPEAEEETSEIPWELVEEEAVTEISSGITPEKLDLNSASLAELEALPGVGFILAQKIIDEREANGPFTQLEDLTRVPGIGTELVRELSGLAEVHELPVQMPPISRYVEPQGEDEVLLIQGRNSLVAGDLPHAREQFRTLIQKNVFLPDIIRDLQEALYQQPEDESIWETLGDAYIRNDQLEEALDAYSRAEELLG